MGPASEPTPSDKGGLGSIVALLDAFRAGDVDGVARRLEADEGLRQRIDEPLVDGKLPLLVAAANGGQAQMVKRLVALGADLDVRADDETTCGVLDAMWDAALASWLIDQGLALDPFTAARWGRLDELRDQLAARPGAHAEGRPGGMTPLHVARTPEVVDVLLDAGATLDPKEERFLGSPLQWAVTEAQARPGVAEHLLNRGARGDVFAWAALGLVDALDAALIRDPASAHQRVDAAFLGDGEHVDRHHIYWFMIGNATPLQVAAFRGQLDAASMILRHGADPNAHVERRTALHWAAGQDHVALVKVLLEAGADPTMRDAEFDATPRGWAEFHGAQGALALLGA